MNKTKILAVIVSCMMLVFAMATCFATSGSTPATSSQSDFISALAEGINADTMWGAVTPVAPIIIFVFLFAFGYRIIKRVTKKGSAGKFGM